jgi:hypothetical protein
MLEVGSGDAVDDAGDGGGDCVDDIPHSTGFDFEGVARHGS